MRAVIIYLSAVEAAFCSKQPFPGSQVIPSDLNPGSLMGWGHERGDEVRRFLCACVHNVNTIGVFNWFGEGKRNCCVLPCEIQ